ncbi:MAG: TonB-dependent receptor [Sinimarinibacterium flocculans]|uniref:TonB-dependent receptor n=1 Tax=Sinimarinibacterium flocculans TaxID=985250 RepID=UPI003C5BEA2F
MRRRTWGVLLLMCIVAPVQAQDEASAPEDGLDALFTAPDEQEAETPVYDTIALPEPTPEPLPPPAPGPTPIENIVVTAQKREQFIYDVPMSITALSGDELEKLGAENLRDIATVTPSFSVVESGPGVQHLQMRGISSAHGQATVGYQLDNVSLASFSLTQPDAATFDLAAVEVLRGPQGTLYGEGSMGGTVKLLTRQPRLGEWQAIAKGDAFLTDGGDPSLEGNAALNVPLADSAALRLVGGVADLGGFIDQVELDEKNHNRARKKNGRARLRWEPGERLILGAMALYQSIDAGSVNAADAEYRKYDGIDVGVDDHGRIFGVDVQWMPDFADVFWTASQFSRQNAVVFDARDTVVSQLSVAGLLPIDGLDFLDAITGPIAEELVRGSPGGYAVDTDSRMTELRLSSKGPGALFWTAGLYARKLDQLLELDASIQLNAPLPQTPLGPLAIPVIDVVTHTDSLAGAVFGQIEYDWTPWLNTALGARYFREKLDISSRGNAVVFDADSDDRLSYSAFTPRAVVSARAPAGLVPFAETALFYLSYAEGFRSGGANIQAAPEIPPTYAPDTLQTWELGTKLELWERRLTAEVAVYYNRWNDVQVVIVPEGGTGNFTAIANSGNAEGRGIDWNLVLSPWPRVRLYQSGGYIDTRFVTDTDSKRKGDPIDFVSPLTLAVGASVGFEWFGGYPGSLRVDYSYADRSRYQRQDSFDRYSDPARMLHARLSVDTANAQFALYGRNLLDNEGALDANAPERQARARPPHYGVEMKIEF